MLELSSCQKQTLATNPTTIGFRRLYLGLCEGAQLHGGLKNDLFNLIRLSFPSGVSLKEMKDGFSKDMAFLECHMVLEDLIELDIPVNRIFQPQAEVLG